LQWASGVSLVFLIASILVVSFRLKNVSFYPAAVRF
jgi:hypothetical protein